MTVGQKIKSRRIELNMSQDELAKKCGYKSRSSINKIEMSRDLPLKKVKQMADALDLSVSYLMGWNESEPDEEYKRKLNNKIAERLVIDPFTIEELDLLNDFKTLTPEEQRQVVLMIAFLKDQQNKK